MEDTDLLLVERAGTSYKIETQDMSNLKDSDLLLVERAGVSYKMTADQLPSSGPTGSIEQPVSVLTPFNGAGLNAGEAYQPLSTAITAVGTSGDVVYATDTIASVTTSTTYQAGIIDPSAMGVSNGSAPLVTPNSADTNDVTWFERDNGTDADPLSSSQEPGWQSYLMFDFNNAGDHIVTISGSGMTGVINGIYTSSTGLNGSWAFVESWTMANDSETRTIQGERYLLAMRNGTSNVNTVPPGPATSPYWFSASSGDATTLTFPTSNNFDKFEVGEVVQDGDIYSVYGSGQSATDATWSDWANFFKYKTSPGADNLGVATYDGEMIWDYPQGLPVTGTTTIWLTPGSGSLFVTGQDGIEKEVATPGSGNIKIDITSFIGNTLYKFRYGSPGGWAYMYGLEVAGALIVDGTISSASITAIDPAGPTITVDGGSWLGANGTGDVGDGRFVPSQEYTQPPIFNDNGFGPYTSTTAAFDGDLTTRSLPLEGGTWEWNFPTITAVQTLKIYGDAGTTWTGSLLINGQTAAELGVTDWSGGFLNFSGVVTELNSIAINYLNGTSYCYLNAVEVNGALLVDSSIPGGPGATDITKTVSSDASLTFTDNTELANMVGPLSQVDENGNVKTPVTSEIASVSGDSQLTPAATLDPNGPYGNNQTKDYTSLFGAASITGIKGIALYKGGSNSAALFNFLLDDVPSQALFTNASFYGEAFAPASDWISGTNSYFQTNAANPDQNGFYWFTSDLVDVTGKNIKIVTTDYSEIANTIQVMAQDGLWYNLLNNVRQPPPNPNTVLTFTTPNPDLKYFQPGDQIGTESGFTPVAYTGNGGTQSIKTGFSPDLVWIKSRNSGANHHLFDTVRPLGQSISSNSAAAAYQYTTLLTAFDADGFSVGDDNDVNGSSGEYIAWCWDSGDTTVINNDGDIESQVRSNGSFSVVNYSGAGIVGHGLGRAPSMIIIKPYADVVDWAIWFTGFGTDYYLYFSTEGLRNYTGAWSQIPDDDTFSTLIGQTGDQIAYCWAEAPGVSSFGEFTGTGSAGINVSCGFEPAFVLVKDTTSTNNWIIWDNARNPSNPRDNYLNPDTGSAETVDDSSLAIDFTPTGFTVNGTSTAINTTNNKYIYAAFAGYNPIEVVDVDVANNTMTVDGGNWSDGKVTGFTPVAYTGNGSSQSITGLGFSPDLVWIKNRNSSYSHQLFDTVRGAGNKIYSNSTGEQDGPNLQSLSSFDVDGFSVGNDAAVNSDNLIAWCWDAGDTTVTNNEGTLPSQVRSNGNFSVITVSNFTNEQDVDSFGHGLSSAPKFILGKNTGESQSWAVYHEDVGTGKFFYLNSDAAPSGASGGNYYNQLPTDSLIKFRALANTNNYVFYAWAQTPNVSSFGKYTGNANGNGPTIECGFEPAFVLIKSLAAENWLIVDSARGEGEGLFPNLSNATGTPGSTSTYLEFQDTGFQLRTDNNVANQNGVQYIYAAFAASSTGETQVTGQPLIASADDVEYLDGNTLGISGVSGTWLAGLHAQGAEVTSSAPSPESIVFTSMNGGTTEFTGTDASLTSRTWTLEKSNAVTGPWTEVGVYLDYAANASQDGAVPWDNPTLEANKFYQVKVEYSSNNASSVVSTFNTFKTGDA